LRGREGFGGPLSLPPSLRARDSDVFEKMKCLFFIAPKTGKGGESPECLSLKNSNWTLDRTQSRVDLRVRSIQTAGRDAHVKVTEPERPVMYTLSS
jgi:hypothetical protein